MTSSSRGPEDVQPRKDPLRFAKGVHKASLVFTVIGILIVFIGIVTPWLFNVYIYDRRRSIAFYNIHVPVGLFTDSPTIKNLDKIVKHLPIGLNLTDPIWIIAKFSCVLGLICAFCAFVTHLMIYNNPRRRNNSCTIGLELGFILASVLLVLLGLSCAEAEIEQVHDNNDHTLTQFMLNNKLLDSNHKQNDFDLVVSKAGVGIHILIAGEFTLLFSYFCILTYLVRFREERKKRDAKLKVFLKENTE